MRLARDPKKIYLQLNEKYFNNELPLDTEVKFVDFPGTGEGIDTRCDSAACSFISGKPPLIEIHSSLKAHLWAVAMVLAHEMVHVKYPIKARRHNAKVWGEEYRRLVGLGFFGAIF